MDVTTFSQRGTDFQPNITINVTRVALSDSMFSTNMTQQGIISLESELIDEFLAAICNDNAVEFEILDQIAELGEILTLNMISEKHETLFDVWVLKQERNTWRLIAQC
jgi:hypothetical protein